MLVDGLISSSFLLLILKVEGLLRGGGVIMVVSIWLKLFIEFSFELIVVLVFSRVEFDAFAGLDAVGTFRRVAVFQHSIL